MQENEEPREVRVAMCHKYQCHLASIRTEIHRHHSVETPLRLALAPIKLLHSTKLRESQEILEYAVYYLTREEKLLKRRFSAIAAVAVALGTCVAVPAAQAATHATIARSVDTIMVGNYKAKVQGIVARDGNQMTTFLPVWYVMQGIKGLGLQATWDYSSKQLMVQTPTEIPVSVTPGPTGTGTTQLLLNGKLVHKVNTIVAKDPSSGQLG